MLQIVASTVELEQLQQHLLLHPLFLIWVVRLQNSTPTDPLPATLCLLALYFPPPTLYSRWPSTPPPTSFFPFPFPSTSPSQPCDSHESRTRGPVRCAAATVRPVAGVATTPSGPDLATVATEEEVPSSSTPVSSPSPGAPSHPRRRPRLDLVGEPPRGPDSREPRRRPSPGAPPAAPRRPSSRAPPSGLPPSPTGSHRRAPAQPRFQRAPTPSVTRCATSSPAPSLLPRACIQPAAVRPQVHSR